MGPPRRSARRPVFHVLHRGQGERPALCLLGGGILAERHLLHTDAWVAKGFGPGFTYSNHVMATGQGYGYGPGGAEVITDTGGTVRIAYHVWENSKPTPTTKGTRIVRVATVTWPGGKPQVS